MKIKGLNNAIADVLKTYTKDIEQELEMIQKKVATNATKKLQQRSPVKKVDTREGGKLKRLPLDMLFITPLTLVKLIF